MYRTTINFHNALNRKEIPISYVVIQTHMGYRAFSEKDLKSIFDTIGSIADGTVIANGSFLAGGASAGIIQKDGRVLSYGLPTRRLKATKSDILGSYQSKELQTLTVELDNVDGLLSRLIAKEPFVGRALKYYIGFESLSQSEHIKIFSGIITEMSVLDVMTIEAQEV